MKILMVSEDIPRPQLGGLARQVVVLANALIDAGHEVVLMGAATPSYESCAGEVGFRGRFIAGFDGLEAGWKEVSLGCFNPFKRGFMAARIARAIQAHAQGFDVVHYHGHYPMLNLHLPLGLPFVQTRHDQGSECLTHMRFRDGDVCRALDPRACAGCIHPQPGPLRTAVSAAAVRRYRQQTAEAFARHEVVFVSDFLRRQFRRAVPQAKLERSQVIHAFIDEAARAEPAAVQAQGGTVIHVAGRLAATKGIVDFIRLLKPVLPAGWRVDVFGDGPQRDELVALCDERIVWHGHRPTAEVMRSSSAASVAVVPSLCEEAWGAVTAEALRFGVPCYALDRGGTPELARYAAPGQLRLFNDLLALVQALVRDPIPGHSPGGDSADVRARLPELLALYEKVRQGKT
jgi:glycosyltransferase involved in cell wall biosynthesis